MEKKDAARSLYMDGFTQKDIASMFRLAENTISRWSQEGGWKERKVSVDLLQDNSTQHILELIHYTTSVLKRRKDNWLEEDPNTVKLLDKGDIDALQKLWTTIRKDSRKFSDYAYVLKEFGEFLMDRDLDLAKKWQAHANLFLNEKRKVL
jgi:transposase